LTRIGEGKRGKPFRYSVSLSLVQLGGEEGRGGIGVPDSCPSFSYIEERKGEVDGTQNEISQKSLTGITGIRVPENRDTDGTQMDTNPKREVSGHESAKPWEEV